MKARYFQRGDAIDFTPETDIAAGDIVRVGDILGVAKLDIKAGELGALALVGVYELATGGITINAGDVVSVNLATGQIVTTGTSGAVIFGHAIANAGVGDSVALVRLEQGNLG